MQHVHTSSKEELYSRLRWLNISRFVISTLIIGSLIFFQERYAIYPFSTAELVGFIILVYGLGIAYRYLLDVVNNLVLFAYTQIAGDILLVSVLVHLTGGIDSGFSPLYHLSIISGSIILFRRGGYIAASISSILYGGMLDMQYYDVLFFRRSHNFSAAQVLYHVLVSIISFYIVALLSGYLSERLRRTRQELQEKSSDFDDLRILQEHILRSVGNGIVTLDLDGRITSWNEAAAQITGYTRQEIGLEWQRVFGEGIKGIFGHTDTLREGPYHFDGFITKKDGSSAILRMTASLLKDEQGSVRGIIIVFQDITRMVEMEERIRRHERLASVGSLAAGIAHEIRNPLASLSGSIEMLRNDLDLKGDNRRLMDIVLREAGRLNSIVTEFLEYARPTPAYADCISLQSIVSETVTLIRNSRDFGSGITIKTDIDPGAEIQGDPQRIRQVFWNLLLNSCQAMPNGGEISIAAALEQGSDTDGKNIIITITDNGEGIKPEVRDRIFDPFFTTKPEGTGLGLAIVYRIISDHNGTIDVDSRPGGGTVAKIVLPCAEDKAGVSSDVSGGGR